MCLHTLRGCHVLGYGSFAPVGDSSAACFNVPIVWDHAFEEGGIRLFQRLSPLAHWSNLFGNLNREMELAQKDRSEDGDDGRCEPSMADPGVHEQYRLLIHVA